jgi:hypothetical protein
VYQDTEEIEVEVEDNDEQYLTEETPIQQETSTETTL